MIIVGEASCASDFVSSFMGSIRVAVDVPAQTPKEHVCGWVEAAIKGEAVKRGMPPMLCGEIKLIGPPYSSTEGWEHWFGGDI